GKALRIARVIRAARLLLGPRPRYFPLDQHREGGFFFALAGFSPCHQALLADALLQELAQQQCLSRTIDGLVTAIRAPRMPLLGDGLRRDLQAIDPDPRPFLFAAGDKRRLAGRLVDLRLHFTWQFLEQRRLGRHLDFRTGAATAVAASRASTTSTAHDDYLTE